MTEISYNDYIKKILSAQVYDVAIESPLDTAHSLRKSHLFSVFMIDFGIELRLYLQAREELNQVQNREVAHEDCNQD